MDLGDGKVKGALCLLALGLLALLGGLTLGALWVPGSFIKGFFEGAGGALALGSTLYLAWRLHRRRV